MDSKKAVIYVRVSTDDQASNGISIENQIQKCSTYCELNDLKIIKIINDAGKSGKNLIRPGIENILEYCKNGMINSVVVYKLDRLSRKTKDMLDLIDTFKVSNVELHSLNEKLYTSTPQGQFFLTMISVLSQLERDQIAECTRDALQYKKNSGFILGRPPYGFIKSEWEIFRREKLCHLFATWRKMGQIDDEKGGK